MPRNHRLICEACGRERLIRLTGCSCGSPRVEGAVADCRGCVTISMLSDAFAEVEQYDVIVRVVEMGTDDIVSLMRERSPVPHSHTSGWQIWSGMVRLTDGKMLVWDEKAGAFSGLGRWGRNGRA